MTLTAEETATLYRLQDKQKSHKSLTNDEINEIERRAVNVIEHQLGPFHDFWESVQKYQDLLGVLYNDNLRLVADVRFLRKKIENLENDAK